MHPLLLSRGPLAVYLLAWSLLGVLQAFLAHANQAPWKGAAVYGAVCALVGIVVFLPSYYPCKALPLRRTPRTTLVLAHLGSVLLLGSLWSGAVFFGMRWARLWPEALVTSLRFYLSLTILGALLALTMLAVNYLLIAQQESVEAERMEQELRLLARNAELKVLRAQLNPHFLFNSLNSISALTTLDPAKARTMCVLLADFFRKGLKLGEQREVSLAEEIDLLRAYLSIEQIRFGTRLEVQWEIAPEVLMVRIPALLLQPLVENAIKHGIAQIPEGGVIRVAASVGAGEVELRVDNPVDEDHEPPQGLGMGLRQVRQRLVGCFGEEIRFEAGTVAGCHQVRMTFPRTPLSER